MSQWSLNPKVVPTESDVGLADLDHIPLKTRQRLLLSNHTVHGGALPATATALASKIDIIVKGKDNCCNDLELSGKQNEHCVVSSSIARESVVSEILESSEIGWSQDIVEPGNQKAQNSTVANSTSEGDSKGVGKVEGCVGDTDLEHISLKERRKMLLGRMALRLAKPKMKENSILTSKSHGEGNPSEPKVEVSCEKGIAPFAGSQFSGIFEKNGSVLCKNLSIGSDSGSQFGAYVERSNSNLQKRLNASSNGSLSEFSSIDFEYSPGATQCYEATAKKPRISLEKVKQNSLPVHASYVQFSTSQSNVQVKIEPLDGCPMQNVERKSSGSPFFELVQAKGKVETLHDVYENQLDHTKLSYQKNPSTVAQNHLISDEQVRVKLEVENPHDVYENELDGTKWCYRMNLPTVAQNHLISDEQVHVKREVETAHEVDEEELDHMKLSDRMKLPTSAKNALNSFSTGEDLPSTSGFSSFTSEYVKPLRMGRPRKRKKTVTDSVETALEEDAPGLLQVLLNQGVLVNEMKLYGETECGDALNESHMEESFSELEDVMSKLLFKRETCVKLLPARCLKGSKPSYCLTCLLSLVEQARYLQFRKWPVEWGWSRELQSFIFVFERHKRIVMERPEYGYATYFFELVDTSPVEWQVKRLVTAMKLTSCGRITLIENKPLLVGEDLTEGEAQVLMDYGWVPNTGLGTMLNYCDRVVHDRKSEKDTSEWRSKICKLLVDGYNNGIVISTKIAETETKTETRPNFRDSSDAPQVKLELC